MTMLSNEEILAKARAINDWCIRCGAQIDHSLTSGPDAPEVDNEIGPAMNMPESVSHRRCNVRHTY